MVILLILGGAGLWVARHWARSDGGQASQLSPANVPEDPRVTYAGPFQNIRPDVSYVGDAACAKCHAQQTESFRRHPMGRSLLPISSVTAQQRYDVSVHNPFEAFGDLFQVERRGERVVHRRIGRDEKGQPIYQSDMPVDYVLGSGMHGSSYLTDRDGYLFQTPISWFSQKQIWDKSPGFTVDVLSGRPIGGECFFCHANRVRPLEGYLNRYAEPLFEGYAIGCERCHGPGGQHVKDPGHKDRATGADYTVVNPYHLEPKLRAAVCEQCHLVGDMRVIRRGRDMYDFRPGLPLEDFWSVFVRDADPDRPRKAVNHVEQMYESGCFSRSEEKPAAGKRKLGCTSCHDPHQQVEAGERAAFYRQRCLECHRQQGCGVPEATRRLKSTDDSCIECHMPKYPSADIAHNASTDHRIVRRPDKYAPAGAGAASPRDGARSETTPQRQRRPRMSSFYRRNVDLGHKELERDLGIALVRIMMTNLALRTPPLPGVTEEAVDLLESALKNDPEDIQAQEARAMALALFTRRSDALAACEEVLAKAPYREVTLMCAAMVAESQQQPALAGAYWRRAVAENPWNVSYRHNIAWLLAEQKAWKEAGSQCEAWLGLDPTNIEARALWVRCLVKTGERDKAKEEFKKIERLKPANLPILQARFTAELHAR